MVFSHMRGLQSKPGQDSTVSAALDSAVVVNSHDSVIASKKWACNRCGRIETVDIKTDTTMSWVCGNPLQNSVMKEGKHFWEDGSCDGTMLFNANTTSLFGGGLKTLNMVKHDRLFLLGAAVNAAAFMNSSGSSSRVTC